MMQECEYRIYGIGDLTLHACAQCDKFGFASFSIAIEAALDHTIPGDEPGWGDFCVVSRSGAKEPAVYHNAAFFACLPAGAYRAADHLYATNGEHAWERFELYLTKAWGYDATKHVVWLGELSGDRPSFRVVVPVDPYRQASLDADLLMQLDEIEVRLRQFDAVFASLAREYDSVNIKYQPVVREWMDVNAAISPARRRNV